MTTPLRVLFVEDSADDVLLLLRELRRGGYAPDHAQVQSREQFRAALTHPWHIVISDYAMPGFGGMEALALLLEAGLDVPFILISGTVGEEIAVEAMRAGASDYVLKENLTRLVPAVRRELREAEGRRQRRAAEAALRESQSLLSLIYNHTSDALSLHTRGADGAWRLASANTTFVRQARALGRSVSEADLLGRHTEAVVADLFLCGPELAAQTARRFDDTARSGKSLAYEQEIERPEGRLFFELTLIPVADAGAPGRHVLMAGRDVTARKRAEEEQRRLHAQLAQAQKMEALGTLAGGIAHDFNNILTAVLGYADLIQRDCAGDERIQSRIDAILTAALRAQELVRQILTFSRKQAPARHPVRLGPVVEEALKLLRASLPAAVELRVHLPETPYVQADIAQMHQVVLNLGTNAMQAMGEGGGVLTVALESTVVAEEFAAARTLRPGSYVRLAVSDTGPGMDAATLEHIFEPFFTTKPPGRGTGLGLAVVHGIVESHEGAIAVYSQPGRGTTFHLYFPTAAEPVADDHALPVEPPRGHGQRVLVLDDEAGVVQLGLHLLERLGYRPEGYTDPRAALTAFATDPDRYDLVLTDLSMPDLSGTEVARRVRALRPEMPVVLTSGFLGPAHDGRPTDYGFQEFLGKPFTLQTVAEVLAAALASRA